jgi:hypothetical protein
MRGHTYIATIWKYEWPHSHNRQPTEYNLGSDLSHARKRARDPVKQVCGTRYTYERDIARADHVAIRRRETRRDATGRIIRVDVGPYEWFTPDCVVHPGL